MLHLSGNAVADQLISDDPLALLIGMVLDQQIPLEWA
ncbi:MAG: Fe-S cluster assembly protein HesB, partial [Acidimicrobiales bacterium]|nr:Fe-S cluster assembly protein HesB [Acidimicrobiales bacterium]